LRLKRLAVAWAPERKAKKFVTAPRGPHKKDECLPLLLIIRDKLRLGENAREARKIIKGRLVKVDGRIVTDPKAGIGIFDTLEVGGKCYRLVPKKKLELIVAKPGSKIVQIIGKKVLKGGRIQINLGDGKNILLEKNAYKVLDSLLISLPEQKIIEHVPLEPGVLVFITKGAHRGRLAKLLSIERERKRVWLEADKKKFEAPLFGVIAVGKEKPLIELGE